MAGLGTNELARATSLAVDKAKRCGCEHDYSAALTTSTTFQFLGVFAADEIPAQQGSQQHSICFIANTDPSTLPGTHWVAFVVLKPKPPVTGGASTVYFFDSYGLPLSFYASLHSECLRRGYATVRAANTLQLQSVHSTVCGQYCILFLFFACRFRSAVLAARTLRDLASSVGRRDMAVLSCVNRLLRSPQRVCNEAVWPLMTGSFLTPNSENDAAASCCVTQCCCARVHVDSHV